MLRIACGPGILEGQVGSKCFEDLDFMPDNLSAGPIVGHHGLHLLV